MHTEGPTKEGRYEYSHSNVKIISEKGADATAMRGRHLKESQSCSCPGEPFECNRNQEIALTSQTASFTLHLSVLPRCFLCLSIFLLRLRCSPSSMFSESLHLFLSAPLSISSSRFISLSFSPSLFLPLSFSLSIDLSCCQAKLDVGPELKRTCTSMLAGF